MLFERSLTWAGHGHEPETAFNNLIFYRSYKDNFPHFDTHIWEDKKLGIMKIKTKRLFYFGLRILLPIQIPLLDIENPKYPKIYFPYCYAPTVQSTGRLMRDFSGTVCTLHTALLA
jgi:hypothetical protein